MATTEKNPRGVKRTASGVPIQTDQASSSTLQAAVEWSNDHEFISPNEIYMNSIGLLFYLTTKRLIDRSFTSLYRRSLKINWENLLKCERKSLKPNRNSIVKCFMINRLITEIVKDPRKFALETGELYREIEMRMSSKMTSTWTLEDFYGHVRSRINLQRRRRLFYISHDEAAQPPTLLNLQRVATEFCLQLLNSYRHYSTIENANNLRRFLDHSFIIVAQPSVPECVAATKYEKDVNGTYSAKLNTRIICLIDPDILDQYFTLSNVGVTLHPCDSNIDAFGDAQQPLPWQKRLVVDADEVQKSFYYFELNSIELKKMDQRNLRPLYSAKLCQLNFYFNIQVNQTNIVKNHELRTQSFGVCSHAQYYPENVAKVLLHEVTQMPQSNGSVVQPNILAYYIYRYHMRISGVEVKSHTSQYIENILRTAYERTIETNNLDSFKVYEDIVSRLVSQMELYIDHQYLPMMYHDGLFLGICDRTLEQQLHGTREQPHLLLCFNSLLTHDPTHQASVQFIVHNDQLIRATFHTKAFVDEMYQMICEANTPQAKRVRLLFENSSRNFQDFCWYFDSELVRLYTAVNPTHKDYLPLIAVLWYIIRNNTNEQGRNGSTPASLSSSTFSSTSEILQTDRTVRHLTEQISDIFAKTSTPTASVLSSALIQEDVQQQKELLFRLLSDYFPSKTYADIATQTSSSTSSDSSFTNISDVTK